MFTVHLLLLASTSHDASAQLTVKAGTSLTVKAGTVLELQTNLGQLTVESGASFTNDGEIYLDASNTVSEQPGNPITGLGTESITVDLNTSSSNQDPGNLGASITSTASLGLTTVTRGHTAQPAVMPVAIERWYEINPTNNSGLAASLKLHYDDIELNGIDETYLDHIVSIDGGTSWTHGTSALDAITNTLTSTKISRFGLHTAHDRGVARVELIAPTDFRLYPNPANRVAWIQLLGERPLPSSLEIRSLTGQTVKQIEVEGTMEVISLDNLESGVYIVGWAEPTSSLWQKLIVE